jgi:hypothetical protein
MRVLLIVAVGAAAGVGFAYVAPPPLRLAVLPWMEDPASWFLWAAVGALIAGLLGTVWRE